MEILRAISTIPRLIRVPGCYPVVIMTCYNDVTAGDSRCVVCTGGSTKDLSVDHKPESDLERTRIEKAGGTVSKDGRVNGGKGAFGIRCC